MTTRHSAGAPAGTGGQFKAEQRPAADFDLPAETPISAEAAYAQFSALVQKVGATGRGVDRAAAVTLAALVRGAHPAARYVEVEPSEQGDYFLPSGPVFDGDHNAVDAEPAAAEPFGTGVVWHASAAYLVGGDVHARVEPCRGVGRFGTVRGQQTRAAKADVVDSPEPPATNGPLAGDGRAGQLGPVPPTVAAWVTDPLVLVAPVGGAGVLVVGQEVGGDRQLSSDGQV